MKQMMKITAAFLLGTTAAQAAGIDRNLTNYGILFEQGNYVELSYAAVRPSVSGRYSEQSSINPLDGSTIPSYAVRGGAVSTGNMSQDFSTLSGSLKYDLTPRLALGLFFNQPFGADASYPGGFYRGLAAEWDSNGQSIVMKYKVTPNISVYGGVRSIESQARIAIPDNLVRLQYQGAALRLGVGAQQAATGAQQAATAAATATDPTQAAALAAQATALGTQAAQLQAQAQGIGAFLAANPAGQLDYTATTDKDRETSYIIGAAYEKPEIALRVALTYESGYRHTFANSESFGGTTFVPTTTQIEMPDVYTLDFQSGVAKDTLVFGSIRHATWSDWQVNPPLYTGTLPGNPRVTGIDSDSTTYRIGVGRKFNETFSGFVRVTYEPGNGDDLSRLAPTDGALAYGIGGTYNRGPVKVTGGVEYITLGDGNDGPTTTNTRFADNDAVAVGVSVGYRF